MNTTALTPLLLATVLLSACESQAPAPASDQESMSGNISTQLTALDNSTPDTTDAVAIINGKPLPRELSIAYREFRKSQGTTKNENISAQEALDELINMQLLVQKAEKENLHKSPVVAMLLRLQHDGILAERIMSKMISENPISEEMIQQEYKKQYADNNQMEYRARHILVKEKGDAEAIIKQLQDGADFAELARDKSVGPSAPYGGELDWFTLDSLVPEFASAVSALDNHQITATPVQTRYGWHVIQLLENREIPAPPLEQVRSSLLTQLKTRKLEESIETLREQADIQILQQANNP